LTFDSTTPLWHPVGSFICNSLPFFLIISIALSKSPFDSSSAFTIHHPGHVTFSLATSAELIVAIVVIPN
jgi:hypothetical protein